MKVELHVIEQFAPDDLSGLSALVDSGEIELNTVVAVLGKTEGNGCVNDFTRGFTNHVLSEYFKGALGEEKAAKIVLIMSGGCEGVMTPHLNIFTAVESDQKIEPTGGLAVLTGKTRDFAPEEIGRVTMVRVVAEAISDLLTEGKISIEDLHFAQIKCPLIDSEAFKNCPQNLVTNDTLKSMGFSRAAAALGVAVATGELSLESITEEAIARDFALYSGVASASSGIELKCCEILLLGNSVRSTSELKIGHAVMEHALDVAAVEKASAASQGGECVAKARIVSLFAKAEPSPNGEILKRRHTMLQDSDVSPTRMARAVVSAVISSYWQEPRVYVSGGAEHQGPPGGGPVAAISRIGG